MSIVGQRACSLVALSTISSGLQLFGLPIVYAVSHGHFM